MLLTFDGMDGTTPVGIETVGAVTVNVVPVEIPVGLPFRTLLT